MGRKQGESPRGRNWGQEEPAPDRAFQMGARPPERRKNVAYWGLACSPLVWSDTCHQSWGDPW